GVAEEKAAQEVGALPKPRGVRVVGEELGQLLAEDGDATRLESHDGDAGAQRGAEFLEDLPQEFSREIQHPVVVERTAAAERPAWDDDREARAFQDVHGRDENFGLEMVSPGIRPQDDPRAPILERGRTIAPPLSEG